MKKAHLWVLVAVTLIFTVFTAGFLMGRNHNADAIVVSVPSQMQTDPTPPAATETISVSPLPPAVAAVVRNTPAIVNINTATKEELSTLPGIGDVLAHRILNYRARNGGFVSPDELMNVDGIGEKRFNDLKDLITIGG